MLGTKIVVFKNELYCGRLELIIAVVAEQLEFESKDCHPHMNGVILRTV
jgi:hypothetical protein